MFEEAQVDCLTDLSTQVPDCAATKGTSLPADRTAGLETGLGDYLLDSVTSGDPGALDSSPATICEWSTDIPRRTRERERNC